ncbi:HNH endonuclease [Litchfieldia alkalitelluris]|uniref:HNH endonuclease n=1 Tax=Litchfieldia alkalitelluris TaxID=304268 RepID=UPI0009971C6C
MSQPNNLQVHHIKPRIKYNGTNGYPDLRFEPSNLITLCQSCNTHFQTREQLDFDWEVPEDDMPVL